MVVKIRKLAYRVKAMRTIRVVMVLSCGVSMEVDALNWKDDTDVQDSESKINPLRCPDSNHFFGEPRPRCILPVSCGCPFIGEGCCRTSSLDHAMDVMRFGFRWRQSLDCTGLSTLYHRPSDWHHIASSGEWRFICVTVMRLP